MVVYIFFFQAEDGIRDWSVTGVQTCALPICLSHSASRSSKSMALVDCLRAAYSPCNFSSTGAKSMKKSYCSASMRTIGRSEERRVGKECRSRWSQYDDKKKKEDESNDELRNK